MDTMKKLGLIGGTGPESTLIYYKKLVYGANAIAGQDFFPRLAIDSVNVFDILKFCSQNDHDSLTDYLMSSVHNLIQAGCEVIALTGNTPHIVFDRLSARSPVPLISMITATRDEAIKRNLKRVGLLGTRFTMMEQFFKTPFIKAGLDIHIPRQNSMEFVANKIASELEHGIVRPETRKAFMTIINEMIEDNAIEAIVLGCTELPLLFAGHDIPLPFLDTLAIHTEALLSFMNQTARSSAS